jgi:hypothetical protein
MTKTALSELPDWVQRFDDKNFTHMKQDSLRAHVGYAAGIAVGQALRIDGMQRQLDEKDEMLALAREYQREKDAQFFEGQVMQFPADLLRDLTPRAIEVIRAVMDDSFPEHTIKFTPWNKRFRPVEYDGAVLVFGRAPEGAVISGVRYVYTYSIAQVMSKSNAASVLKAAVQQVIQQQEPVPFGFPVGVEKMEFILRVLDPTKPTAIDIETSGNTHARRSWAH